MRFCERFSSTRVGVVLLLSAALSACGSESTQVDASASRDSGICGTWANPGILQITDLHPATSATVPNGPIVHSFTVAKAPAAFTAFTLRYGSNHTAGGSVPSDPTIQTTVIGSSIVYQFTIDRWSIAPGHVELKASAGYETKDGCAWAFPTPIMAYDVAVGAGLDGGVDGAMAFDAGMADAPAQLDASAVDVSLADVSLAIDAPMVTVDVPAVDTSVIDMPDMSVLDASLQ